MFRILFASSNTLFRVALALSIWVPIGSAFAADDPLDPLPDVSAAQAARHEPPPVPFNSGVSPREFEADPRKVTLEVLADGTRLYRMNGQGMHAVTARIGADGNIEYVCTDRPEQAAVQQDVSSQANAHEQ